MDWLASHPARPHASFDGGDLDCGSGLLLLIRKHLDPLLPGQLLEVCSVEASVDEDLPAWCRLTGNELVSKVREGRQRRFLIRKAGVVPRHHEPTEVPASPSVSSAPHSLTGDSLSTVPPLPSLAVMGIGGIMAVTGAFYPAIDLGAGEKERGTMETLLISPASRAEIVVGKFLTVVLFSLSTALLNLVSMGITSKYMLTMAAAGQLSRLGNVAAFPPLSALVWLVVLAVPLAALFGALSLALAMFAKSSKEGQYYLTPLLLVTIGRASCRERV